MKNWMVVAGLFCLYMLDACTEKRAEVRLQRAEQTLFTGKSRAAIQAFLNANREFARLYFNTSQFGNDTALVSALYNRINDPELNVLYRQVQDEFTDMAPVSDQLAEAFTNIKKTSLTFAPPGLSQRLAALWGPT